MCTNERRMSTCDKINMNVGDVAITTWIKHVQQRDRYVEIVRKKDIFKNVPRKKSPIYK